MEARGALEALKAALRGQTPHLLVLDGLERVQVEGGAVGGRARGELDDPPLRQLLTLLAGGSLGRTRTVVTSRFPLKDLEPWEARGYRAERLEDLEPAAARSVLEQWGARLTGPARAPHRTSLSGRLPGDGGCQLARALRNRATSVPGGRQG